ncbi:MAG: hypothetical protein ACKPFA_36435, partial [Dolichospermum sp.]
VGEAGLKFKNGDAKSLYECMLKLLTDPILAKQQQEKSLTQLKLFDELELTKKYVDIYTDVINKYKN